MIGSHAPLTLAPVESGARAALPPLLAALLVAALLAVVALGSRGGGAALQPDVGGEPAQVALDTLLYLFLVAGALMLVIGAWVLWPHPDLDLPPVERRRWPVALAVLLSLSVVAAVWWRAGWGPFAGLPLAQRPGAAAGGASAQLHSPAAARGPDWVALGLTALAVLALAVFLLFQALPRRPAPQLRPVVARQQGQLLELAVEEVAGARAPRRAVIAAWAAVESVLTRHGLARRPAEAPYEYSARAFAELGLPAAGLAEFAGLFEWARFSPHEVTAEMREDALARLSALREGLRDAA